MWISRQMFEKLLHERSAAQGASQVFERENITLHATLDWMKLRVNQVEHERAQLLYNYTGVKVPVPQIETAADTKSASDLINGGSALFADMGDEEARRQGVSWDDNGEIKHERKA